MLQLRLRKHFALLPRQLPADGTDTIKLTRETLSVKLTHEVICHCDPEDRDLFTSIPVVSIEDLVFEIYLELASSAVVTNDYVPLTP